MIDRAVQRSGDVQRFDYEGNSTLFLARDLTVIRGDPDILGRAHRFADAGHAGLPLTAEEIAQYESVVAAIRQSAPMSGPQESSLPITQLNISNAYHCNMGCGYCYNELSIKDRKGSESRGAMSMETSRTMIDALLAQAANAERVSLAFIGGEPLLGKESIAKTVEYARVKAGQRDQSVDVAVYTNGTLLDENFVDWASDNDVSVVISLDGPLVQNDRNRVYLSGASTSAKVLKNIRMLMKRSVHAVKRVRAVATRADELVPLHAYLLDLGFNEVHVQPAYDEDGIHAPETLDDVIALLEWYARLLKQEIVIGVLPFEMILERLVHQGDAVTNWYPCTAGRSALGVSPNGDLWPCHHFVEEADHRVGNVADGLPTTSERRRLFVRVDHREPCQTCWARHACGGECYHRAATAGAGYNGVLPSSCERRKGTIGLVLELFADLAASAPEVLRRVALRDYSEVVSNPDAFEMTDLNWYRHSLLARR